jgi:hypothetical protein
MFSHCVTHSRTHASYHVSNVFFASLTDPFTRPQRTPIGSWPTPRPAHAARSPSKKTKAAITSPAKCASTIGAGCAEGTGPSMARPLVATTIATSLPIRGEPPATRPRVRMRLPMRYSGTYRRSVDVRVSLSLHCVFGYVEQVFVFGWQLADLMFLSCVRLRAACACLVWYG